MLVYVFLIDMYLFLFLFFFFFRANERKPAKRALNIVSIVSTIIIVIVDWDLNQK